MHTNKMPRRLAIPFTASITYLTQSLVALTIHSLTKVVVSVHAFDKVSLKFRLLLMFGFLHRFGLEEALIQLGLPAKEDAGQEHHHDQNEDAPQEHPLQSSAAHQFTCCEADRSTFLEVRKA